MSFLPHSDKVPPRAVLSIFTVWGRRGFAGQIATEALFLSLYTLTVCPVSHSPLEFTDLADGKTHAISRLFLQGEHVL
jgi:hypothetical protein